MPGISQPRADVSFHPEACHAPIRENAMMGTMRMSTAFGTMTAQLVREQSFGKCMHKLGCGWLLYSLHSCSYSLSIRAQQSDKAIKSLLHVVKLSISLRNVSCNACWNSCLSVTPSIGHDTAAKQGDYTTEDRMQAGNQIDQGECCIQHIVHR